jgi:hypothetical protein
MIGVVGAMTTKALLVLEDGSVFAGRPFGASARAEGEVVFRNRSGPRAEARGMRVRGK